MRNAPLVDGALAVTTGTEVTTSVPHTPDATDEHDVESYLRSLIALCDDPPLIDELTEGDLGTPRGTASIARAALCWLREKQDDVLKARLRHELVEADWLAAWRLRRLSGDLSEAEDWSTVASRTPLAELQRLRVYGTEAVA